MSLDSPPEQEYEFSEPENARIRRAAVGAKLLGTVVCVVGALYAALLILVVLTGTSARCNARDPIIRTSRRASPAARRPRSVGDARRA